MKNAWQPHPARGADQYWCGSKVLLYLKKIEIPLESFFFWLVNVPNFFITPRKQKLYNFYFLLLLQIALKASENRLSIGAAWMTVRKRSRNSRTRIPATPPKLKRRSLVQTRRHLRPRAANGLSSTSSESKCSKMHVHIAYLCAVFNFHD